MSASVSSHQPQAGNAPVQGHAPPVSPLADASATAPPATRVLSVSPRLAPHAAEPKSICCRAQLLQPDAAARDLQAGLQSLMTDARDAGADLRALIEASSQCVPQVSPIIEQLQERLRLGAQMIKAIASQITRLEQAAASLKEHEHRIEACRDAALAQIQAAQSNFEQSVRSHVQNLETFMEAQLARANAQPPPSSETAAASAIGGDEITVDLLRLLQTMREVGDRIAHLTALNQPASAAGLRASGPTEATERSESSAPTQPMLEIAGPLRFKKCLG